MPVTYCLVHFALHRILVDSFLEQEGTKRTSNPVVLNRGRGRGVVMYQTRGERIPCGKASGQLRKREESVFLGPGSPCEQVSRRSPESGSRRAVGSSTQAIRQTEKGELEKSDSLQSQVGTKPGFELRLLRPSQLAFPEHTSHCCRASVERCTSNCLFHGGFSFSE